MYKINKSSNTLPVTVDKIRLRARVSKTTFHHFFHRLDELLLIDKFYERPSTSLDYRYNLIIKTRGASENATVYIGYVAGVAPAENTATEASLVIEFNPNKVDYENLVFYLLFYYGILDNYKVDRIDVLGADVAFDFFDKDITFFKVITSKTIFKHFQNTFGNTKYYGAKKHSQIRLYDKIGETKYEYDQLLQKDIKDKTQRDKRTAELCREKYGPTFDTLKHWTRLEVSYKIKNGNLKYIYGDPKNRLNPTDEITLDEKQLNDSQDEYNQWRETFRQSPNQWNPNQIILNDPYRALNDPYNALNDRTHYSIEETGKINYTPYISPQETFQRSNIKLFNPYQGEFDMNFSYPIIGYFEDLESFGITKPVDKAFLISYMFGYMEKDEIPRRNFEKIKEAISSVQSHLQINELYAPYALREYTKNFFKITTDHFQQDRPAGMSLQEYIIPDYKREIKQRYKTEYKPARIQQAELILEWKGNKKETTENDFTNYTTIGEAI